MKGGGLPHSAVGVLVGRGAYGVDGEATGCVVLPHWVFLRRAVQGLFSLLCLWGLSGSRCDTNRAAKIQPALASSDAVEFLDTPG